MGFTEQKPKYTKPDMNGTKRFKEFIKYILNRDDVKYCGSDIGHGIMIALRSIWKHGIIILLLVLPTLLLVSLPQGTDLILNMIADSGASVITNILRVLWFLLTLVFSTYAIWAIPRFYQTYEVRNKDKCFEKSTSSTFLRVLGSIPFIIYGLSFFLVTERCEIHWFLYWFLIIGLAIAIFMFCLHLHYNSYRSTIIGLIGIITAIITAIVPGWLFNKEVLKLHELGVLLLGNGMLLLSGLTYVALVKWETKLKEIKEKKDLSFERILRNKGDKVYSITFFLSVIIMVLFSFVSDMTYVTTISLLTLVMGSLILWFNYISYCYKRLEGGKQLGVFAILTLIIIFVHSPESKPHRIYLVEETSRRESLENYMEQWFEKRKELVNDNSNTKYPIYLIAGEGGGSRAGLWYSNFMIKMDHWTNGQFSKNTFATSTVSGSSVGASLLAKAYRAAHDLGADRQDLLIDTVAINFFSHNFLSGSIFDLFFLDFVRRFQWFPTRSGRNLRLQKEENAAYFNAMNHKKPELIDMARPIRGWNKEYEMINGKQVRNYHFLPLTSIWKEQDDKFITDIPLIFFNTTHMPTGQPRVLSPVSFDFNEFTDSLDLISMFHKKSCCLDSYKHNLRHETCNRSIERQPNNSIANIWNKINRHENHCVKGKTIALGTANNISENFPFFSAYTYVDNIGHCMDAGGFDNSGAYTLKLIYETLFKFLKSKNDNSINYIERFPIVVIYISNGNEEDPETIEKRKGSKIQLLALAGQVGNQPFEAIEPLALHDLKKAVALNGSEFIEASYKSLKKRYSCPIDCLENKQRKFPTARSLTTQNVNSLISYSSQVAENVCDYLSSKNLLLK